MLRLFFNFSSMEPIREQLAGPKRTNAEKMLGGNKIYIYRAFRIGLSWRIWKHPRRKRCISSRIVCVWWNSRKFYRCTERGRRSLRFEIGSRPKRKEPASRSVKCSCPGKIWRRNRPVLENPRSKKAARCSNYPNLFRQ